jgi:enterobactin synthetase component D
MRNCVVFHPRHSPALFPPGIAHISGSFDRDASPSRAAAALGVVIPPALARAVSKRRMDFVVGRHCAAQALRLLDPSLPSEVAVVDGVPVWPPGTVGSITHTGAFVSAAVAPSRIARGLGLDSEHVVDIETLHSVSSLVLNTSDRVCGTAILNEELFCTIVFSAKESVFKCLYPLVRTLFLFEHAGVTVFPDDGGFEAHVLIDLDEDVPAGFTMKGRFVVQEGVVHTGVLLRAD